MLKFENDLDQAIHNIVMANVNGNMIIDESLILFEMSRSRHNSGNI